jgi:hypothetical protein
MTVTHLTGAESPQIGHPAESNRNNGSVSPLFKGTKSAPDRSRRHSLPLNFLPPNIWNANTSRASLVESEEAARGEHILDEATVAHRISALRQLNGGTQTSHRYAKSTGARNSTFSQPVIVRTYSGTRPQTRQRELPVKREIQTMGRAELPPVEAFSFKGIMESIQSGVTEDLERIAEICARSRYSLSNQYEVHMPPHGEGDHFLLQNTGNTTQGNGPTLQAIGSDDEQSKPPRIRTGRQRTKSIAYGTLETIMSSSKSSEEDKTEKKSAKEIAEEVRGRAAKKATIANTVNNHTSDEHFVDDPPDVVQRPKQVRSRSATFASIIIDSVHGSKGDSAFHPVPPSALISRPARPQTSVANQVHSPMDDSSTITSPRIPSMSSKLALIRQESIASTLKPESDQRPSVLSSLSSWLSWGRPTEALPRKSTDHMRRVSNAEGSLRELLKATEVDKKGKAVDRTT